MGRLPQRARAYLLFVVGCAVLMLLDAAPFSRPPGREVVLACAVMGVMLLLADTHMIELSHTTKVSVSTAVEFALLLMVGPALTIWTLAVCVLVLARWQQVSRGWRWYNVAFYGANLVVSVGVAGMVYRFTAGSSPILSSTESVLGILLAAATYFVLNVGNVAVMVSLARNADTASSFLAAFQVALPQFAGLLALGVVTAVVYTSSPVAAMLLTIPLGGVYVSLKSSLAVQAETKHALETLAIQIDRYHPYTAEHSERVAAYSTKIARSMHLAEDQVETITRAAKIHDLGKLAIWRDMLNKPTALSDEERAELETHPARGADLVSGFADYRSGRDLILHHHERYDGHGYPKRLAGEEIPLGARIIAAADAADAMMSDRPYRKAMTVADAIRELERNRGKQFDPIVVDAILSILEKESASESHASLARAPMTI